MTSKALYPGSFDPLHLGHVEIIETAAALFDTIVVGAVGNPQKTTGLFSLAERIDMIVDALSHLANVEVTAWSGLVVDLAREVEADFVVKGLRTVTDFEDEMQMALMNRAVTGMRTVFLPSASEHSFVASKYIRDIARLGGDVRHLVPPAVAKRLDEKFPR